MPPCPSRSLRTRRHRLASAAALVAALTLSGCFAAVPTADHQVSLGDLPKRAPAQTPTQRENQRILAAYGGAYDDARLEGLINKTVERLVAASERPDLHYRVTLLNSASVNAFALPTGQLYVTRGLIALANDESELASVLAHEMAHVIARHAAIREDQARQAAIVSQVVNDVLSDPEVGALALAKSKVALASFSRAQEFEADGIGVGIAARAGYDPYGAARFLAALGHNAALKPTGAPSKDTRNEEFLSTHPATPERVANATLNARQYTPPAGGERDRAEYLRAVDGLIFGEDASEGYVRGRRFLHAKLGFTFTAPEGFSLDNTAQAVLGVRDGGNEALRLDVVQVPAEQKLTDYLTSGWISNIEPKSVESLSINGFAAATATAKNELWAFRLYAIRFGSDVYRFIFAGKHKTPEMDRAFRQSVDSFRRMSLSEIDRTSPLRVKLVTVAAGDTVDRLAARMAVADRHVERFRVLNGIEAGTKLKPGEQVKIVVE